jgi:ketosteroid isomerase-like protein
LKARAKNRIPETGQDLINEYFKCIDNKDLDGLLDLFDYDAVVHEPFSNITGGLQGRSSIEPFLKVAMMANANFRRNISIDKSTKPNRLTAMVTFEKGDRVKGRFTFEFSDGTEGRKTIKSLKIEFM